MMINKFSVLNRCLIKNEYLFSICATLILNNNPILHKLIIFVVLTPTPICVRSIRFALSIFRCLNYKKEKIHVYLQKMITNIATDLHYDSKTRDTYQERRAIPMSQQVFGC